jgi:hypothetical protein
VAWQPPPCAFPAAQCRGPAVSMPLVTYGIRAHCRGAFTSDGTSSIRRRRAKRRAVRRFTTGSSVAVLQHRAADKAEANRVQDSPTTECPGHLSITLLGGDGDTIFCSPWARRPALSRDAMLQSWVPPRPVVLEKAIIRGALTAQSGGHIY